MEKSIQDATQIALGKYTDIYSAEGIKRGAAEFFSLGFDSTFFQNYTAEELSNFLFGYLSSRARQDKKHFWSLSPATGGFVITTRNTSDQREVDIAIDDLFLMPQHNEQEADSGVSVRCFSSSPSPSDGVSLYIVKVSPWQKRIAFDRKSTSSLAHGSEYFFTQNANQVNRRSVVERYDGTIAALRASLAHSTVATVTVSHETSDGHKASAEEPLICMQLGINTLHGASFFSALSLLIAHEVPASAVYVKKIVETFRGAVHVYTFFLSGASIEDVTKCTSHLHMLPSRSTTQPRICDLFLSSKLSVHESLFATAATIFATYFTPSRHGTSYKALSRILKSDDAGRRQLDTLNDTLFRQIVNEQSISFAALRDVHLFQAIFNTWANSKNGVDTDPQFHKLRGEIDKRYAPGSVEKEMVITALITFSRSIMRTNLFKPSPAAMCFRLEPTLFFPGLAFPLQPYAVYLVVGGHWRAFHVRFQDIARGGIRIIRTPPGAPRERYDAARVSLFHEAYNLAYTQTLKNKDIPEGGSKAAILISTRAASSTPSLTFFLQFIDSMLDLLIPNTEGVTAHGKRGAQTKPEVLFFGPDENTAGEAPSVAAILARRRGYRYWMSLTTGKSPQLGGVPHDVDGMTTRSVRTYVTGVYEKLGLVGANLRKFVVGGPDGDLGSNEIKLGCEQIVAMCDGFASVYDKPALDQKELLRLANERLSLAHFDKSKLSTAGFKVLVADRNVTLPDGTVVENGEHFRNNFHFSPYSSADVFVPCGGRPACVVLDNVYRCFEAGSGVDATLGEAMLSGSLASLNKGAKLKWSIICEGANLFFTNEARIVLEKSGAILFKDASTNKGGVCASSNEVFVGLALNAEQHSSLMCVKDAANPPAFYTALKKSMIARIELNARREFDCLWRETRGKAASNAAAPNSASPHQTSPNAAAATTTATEATDALSLMVFRMKGMLMKSDLLVKNPKLFRYIIDEYLPAPLKKEVPLDAILERVPRAYLVAIACTSVASQFAYRTFGMLGTEVAVAFHEFVSELTAKAEAAAGESSKL